jgi:hypothetical protein
LEAAARRKLGRDAADRFIGGAGRERTMAANRAAFDSCQIVQRMLRDLSDRDLSVDLFGRGVAAPILLAPIGVLDMAHRQADLAANRAAPSARVGFVTSTQAYYPMEAVAEAAGQGLRWFQLYWSACNELVESFAPARRARRLRGGRRHDRHDGARLASPATSRAAIFLSSAPGALPMICPSPFSCGCASMASRSAAFLDRDSAPYPLSSNF